MEVNQDTEEPQASVADEGKHQRINLSNFLKLCNFLFMFVHLRSGVEMRP
jgi:hypothetical protein